ncbi:sulfatase-like hydrolase/transferase [Sphingobacterium sp. E70]|uniref:sulfatase-like hydrolase/transferase n=1 Tax=Sphingobacterium sp. E70 TaxID=2853439 RepID=UPI00211C175D|nr:sulfatase-like hydrolase/transferase [Sphingobacterium sp. E70]ULT25440.1 sulfatase-like hydrolase/transferase [Sphingobacterium sp. E70]
MWGASNFYEINDPENPTVPLYRNNKAFYLPKNRYLTDEITDQAIGFLREQAQDKKPFFLYLAFNAPHWPLQAPEEETQKYNGVYQQGWDSLRVKRYENALQKVFFLKVS